MAGKFVGSKFVVTDPDDPEAPRVLAEYVTNPTGHLLTPGLVVTYVNPAMPGLGNPTPDGGPMTVAELILYADPERPYVEAILDGGAYSCGADNLVPFTGVVVTGPPEPRPPWAELGTDTAGHQMYVAPPGTPPPGAEEVARALVESGAVPEGATVEEVAAALGLAREQGIRPLAVADSPGPATPEATDNAAGPGARRVVMHHVGRGDGQPERRGPVGEPPAVEVRVTADAGRAEIGFASALAAADLAVSGAELPGEWPDLSVCTATAFAAYESIQAGAWDPFLPILGGAISARLRAMRAEAVEAVRAAGGDPDDPDDPAWTEVDRAWRPPRRRAE
jgi:hypothetical protein